MAEVAQTSHQPSQEPEDLLGALIKNVLTAESGAGRDPVMEALTVYKDLRGREGLIQALQDPDAPVRENAVRALAHFYPEAAVDHLRGTLEEDANEHVRAAAAAAAALAEIASPHQPPDDRGVGEGVEG
jgi:HEAT repeat protein